MDTLLQIPVAEAVTRTAKIQSQMNAQGIDALLISDNANKFYVSGRVYNGYAYIPAKGNIIHFVRRPVGLSGDNLVYIHKPENIPAVLTEKGIASPSTFALELDVTPYSTIQRLSNIFPQATITNASAILRQARAIKTGYEIEALRESGIKHAKAYSAIPKLYKMGMSDLEFQIEIERASRLEGCLGEFRISGDSMEIYMGNVICGENADTPSPYDFAMGGAGINPSLPVGCNGTETANGMAIMVDVNGNYTGYMTDMTRVFSVGELDDLSVKAHSCSRRICKELSAMGKPGVEAKALYNRAIEIVTEEKLEHLFMGHRQKAGFIGHGVGIEINELPVIAPKSRDILAEGNAIALEPKFVIPGVGAVGVENTYIITTKGMECTTNAPEEIINLI